MVLSVMFHPGVPAFFLPAWLQLGIVIGVLGVSGWAAKVLPKHPKFQNVTVALAMAFMCAVTIAQAPQIQGAVVAFFMGCNCYWGWESWCCYF